MKTLSTEIQAQIRKLHNDGPWHELWRIQIDQTTSATTWAALVRHSAPVVFGGVTYQPFPLTRSEISQDTDGNLPSTTLGLSNVSRSPARWAQIGKGMQGRPVELHIVHSAHLDSSAHSIRFDFTCNSVSLTSEALALDLRSPNLFDIQVPQDRFSESRCTFVYKGPLCRYNGSLPTCNKTLGDCIAHGQDEISRGLPPTHPLFFGAFPGITRGVRR